MSDSPFNESRMKPLTVYRWEDEFCAQLIVENARNNTAKKISHLVSFVSMYFKDKMGSFTQNKTFMQ